METQYKTIKMNLKLTDLFTEEEIKTREKTRKTREIKEELLKELGY